MLQIITDSAADITLKEAEALRIHIAPLRITFEDGDCPQETVEDFLKFYDRLAKCSELPKTSQVSPDAWLQYIEQAREAGDEVLIIALSGGLSGTVQSANAAMGLSGYDKVRVVDSHQAITAQRLLVEEAVKLRDQGEALDAIVEKLEALRDRITVSGVVDTLVNLRKGGRIPASLAILGEALKIKPVIALQGTKLEAIAKALGRNAGKQQLLRRMEKYPPAADSPFLFGYTSDRELTGAFMEEVMEKYSISPDRVRLLPVGGVIGTHVGNNCIAICYIAQEAVV